MLIAKFLFNQLVIVTALYLFGFTWSDFLARPVWSQIFQLMVVLPLFEFQLLYLIMDWKFMDKWNTNSIFDNSMLAWRKTIGDLNARIIVYFIGLVILSLTFILPYCVLAHCHCGNNPNKCEEVAAP